MDKLVIIIGRGHSGTRAISRTLVESGVFMGETLNDSYDLIPPESMYEACRVFGKMVKYLGNFEWDFSHIKNSSPNNLFRGLVFDYISSVMKSNASVVGWKLPETNLVFPWIVEMFPNAYFIHWVRHPYDCILGYHLTDDLRDFGVDYDVSGNKFIDRAASWKYQVDIVRQFPRPNNFLVVRFEDFVLNQDTTVNSISEFLGIEVKKIPVNYSAVGRWKTSSIVDDIPFLEEHMKYYGYENINSNTNL